MAQARNPRRDGKPVNFKMTKYKNKYRVETTRLKNWDYSSAGWYFVTICTKNRKPYFGEILDDEMHLSPIGKILAEEWQKTAHLRPNVSLGEWVIMPNHIHGIIIIHSDEDVETSRRDVSTEKPRLRAKSLGAIINQIKSVSTKRIRAAGFTHFSWQRGYYDHIIRDNTDLDRIREYIIGNPYNWNEDAENPVNVKRD
jgi:REP element-mobilizing transposase RayT